MKRVYKYKVNWYGEDLEGYTQAYSDRLAELNIIQQLAWKVQMSAYYVRQYLMQPNKLSITIEK